MLEIDKIITVSTFHISYDSYTWLELECETYNNPLICPYKKDEFGFVLYINKQAYFAIDKPDIPDDIYRLIQLAIDNDCAYLCLDVDGLSVPNISTYKETYPQ